MSYFIFGDVHGDARALKALIARAREFSGPDLQIFSVGDLLDRGPNSKEVIEVCIRESVQGLLGNHELWMHKYLTTGKFDEFALHGVMGGKKTLSSYGISPDLVSSEIEKTLNLKIPDSHREFFLGLPLSRNLEIGGRKYRLTHGGIPIEAGKQAQALLVSSLAQIGFAPTPEEIAINIQKMIEDNQPEIFVWGGAKKNRVFEFPDGSYQVFGHTPWRGGAEISDEGKYIALDTGCGTCPPYLLSGVLLNPDGGRTILTQK
jgi:hypothetical protein